MTFSSDPSLSVKDPDYNMRDNLKNQSQKYFSFKSEFPLDKIEWQKINRMEEMQCSQEIILSFMNRNFFCEYFHKIPEHFHENIEILGLSRYFQNKR